MIEDAWIPYHEVEWGNADYHSFHVDTRDFRVLCSVNTLEDVNAEKQHPRVIPDRFKKKYNQLRQKVYFYTVEEVIEIIYQLHHKSGGDGEWRMLSFMDKSKWAGSDWSYKYLRIFRVDDELMICNDRMRPIPRVVWNLAINKELLAHQKR